MGKSYELCEESLAITQNRNAIIEGDGDGISYTGISHQWNLDTGGDEEQWLKICMDEMWSWTFDELSVTSAGCDENWS